MADTTAPLKDFRIPTNALIAFFAMTFAITWGIVGLVFNGYLKKRYTAWWMRYNYILSAGLDAALAIGSFL